MLDLYEVEVNGYPTVLQLTEEDAKLRGLEKSDTVAAKAEAAEKAAEAKALADAEAQRIAAEAKAKADAEAQAKADAEAKAAAAPVNKGRNPANKAAGADQK